MGLARPSLTAREVVVPFLWSSFAPKTTMSDVSQCVVISLTHTATPNL